MSTPQQVTVPGEAGDGDLPALLWHPAGGGGGEVDRPALVVLQEIFGLTRYVRDRCAALADQGYLVLAPQLYARLDPPVPALEDDHPDLLETAMGLLGRLDWDLAVRDAVAAHRAAAALPGVAADRVGLLGYCFGGGLAFAAAARLGQDGTPPAALVCYYGSALPQLLDLAPRVECPSLHHFGTQDAYLPMGQVDRITAAVTADGTRPQVQVQLHPDAGHAFDNPLPAFHHPRASADAALTTHRFLARVLPVDPSGSGPGVG